MSIFPKLFSFPWNGQTFLRYAPFAKVQKKQILHLLQQRILLLYISTIHDTYTLSSTCMQAQSIYSQTVCERPNKTTTARNKIGNEQIRENATKLGLLKRQQQNWSKFANLLQDAMRVVNEGSDLGVLKLHHLTSKVKLKTRMCTKVLQQQNKSY